jgi:hypothetical protein
MFISDNAYGQPSGTCHEGNAPGRAVRSDVNGDGMADLVTLVDGTAYTYLGSPDATLIPAPPALIDSVKSALWEGDGHLVIDVADVDGDYAADLVTAYSDGSVRVFRGALGGTFLDGVASFGDTYPLADESTEGFEPFGVGDVNGDGFGDLVSHRDGNAYVHLGKSDATFGSAVESFHGTLNSARFDGSGHFAVDVADVTGDGRADLVTVVDGGVAYVYPGQASGAFGSGVPSFEGTYHVSFLDADRFEPVSVADVTGDGRADLVSAHTNGTVYVHLGTATGAFTPRIDNFEGAMPTSLFTGDGYDFIAALDINGDGRSDLVSAQAGIDIRPAKSTGAFDASIETFAGTFNTTRFNQPGYEAANEKTPMRRRGCTPTGCF